MGVQGMQSGGPLFATRSEKPQSNSWSASGMAAAFLGTGLLAYGIWKGFLARTDMAVSSSLNLGARDFSQAEPIFASAALFVAERTLGHTLRRTLLSTTSPSWYPKAAPTDFSLPLGFFDFEKINETHMRAFSEEPALDPQRSRLMSALFDENSFVSSTTFGGEPPFPVSFKKASSARGTDGNFGVSFSANGAGFGSVSFILVDSNGQEMSPINSVFQESDDLYYTSNTIALSNGNYAIAGVTGSQFFISVRSGTDASLINWESFSITTNEDRPRLSTVHELPDGTILCALEDEGPSAAGNIRIIKYDPSSDTLGTPVSVGGSHPKIVARSNGVDLYYLNSNGQITRQELDNFETGIITGAIPPVSNRTVTGFDIETSPAGEATLISTADSQSWIQPIEADGTIMQQEVPIPFESMPQAIYRGDQLTFLSSDGNGTARMQSYRPNSPPSVIGEIGNITLDSGGWGIVNLTDYFGDLDIPLGDCLSFSTSGSSAAQVQGDQLMIEGLPQNEELTDQAVVWAQDGIGQTAQSTATIHTRNTPPHFAETTTITASVMEAQNSTIPVPQVIDSSIGAITYSLEEHPSFVQMTPDQSGISIAPVIGDAELSGSKNYSFYLVGRDVHGAATERRRIETTIQRDHPPIYTGTAPIKETLLEGSVMAKPFPTVTDEDPNTLTYALANNPSWVSITTDLSDATVQTGYSIDPPFGLNGNYSFDLVVTDQHGQNEIKTIQIVVEKDLPPFFTETTDITESLHEGAAIFNSFPLVSDEEPSKLIYSLENNPPWVKITTDPSDPTIQTGYSIEPPLESAKEYSFDLVVTDLQGQSDRKKIKTNVTPIEVNVPLSKTDKILKGIQWATGIGGVLTLFLWRPYKKWKNRKLHQKEGNYGLVDGLKEGTYGLFFWVPFAIAKLVTRKLHKGEESVNNGDKWIRGKLLFIRPDVNSDVESGVEMTPSAKNDPQPPSRSESGGSPAFNAENGASISPLASPSVQRTMSFPEGSEPENGMDNVSQS